MNSTSDSTESCRLVREVMIRPKIRPAITSVIAMAVLQIWACAMAGLLAGLGATSLVLKLDRSEPLPPLQPESPLLPVLEQFERERSYIDPTLSRMLLRQRMRGVHVVGDGTRRSPLHIAESWAPPWGGGDCDRQEPAVPLVAMGMP